MEVNDVSPDRVAVKVTEDKIYIKINRNRILPAYLHYLLEYKGIDYSGKTIVFNDCECKLIREGLTSRWG